MNHYDRLKVSRDAPVEVIRAAYRALAAKHHPDRHTQPDAAHADMAALNAAYEILANPITRSAYDAESASSDAKQPAAAKRRSRPWRQDAGKSQSGPFEPTHFQSTQFQAPSTNEIPLAAHEKQIDINWVTSPSALPISPWLSRKRLLPLLGLAGVLAAGAAVMWGRDAVNQMEAERTLSSRYRLADGGAADVAGVAGTAAPAAASTAALRDDQLPSDEELLAEPPPMPGRTASIMAGSSSRHPLDGTPLALREDLLIELFEAGTLAAPAADHP